MCAFLLGILPCVFVRVATDGILYQQANYDLLKEGHFSFFLFIAFLWRIALNYVAVLTYECAWRHVILSYY
jgi:hypothetical protein